jgi:alpha-galactosidase
VFAAPAFSDETQSVEQWVNRVFDRPQAVSGSNPSDIPFSFTYGGISSRECLPQWEYASKRETIPSRWRRQLTYKDPKTGLAIECELTGRDDFAAVDWVCRLVNTGDADTPIIENFLTLDCENLLTPIAVSDPVVLRWSNGDRCASDSFVPHDEPLAPGQSKRFAPAGGRSSNDTAFPFFNLLGPKYGWIVAVGWSGQWAAEFARQANGGVAVRAGVERTRFRLRPGERVRMPRIALVRYPGNEMMVGHNRFRQLMLAHYVPRVNGQPAAPPISHATSATIYRNKQPATESNQLAILEKAARLGVEAYWLDAYWYGDAEIGSWYRNVGTWQPRPDGFPRGLRPLGDAAHKAGMKFILWFEPERVHPGTAFDKEHPEFLLKLDAGNRLFDLGNPQALQFLIDFLDQRIKQWGVDIYRQDFNMDPLPFWRKHDAEDRQGITEIRYVEGLYRLWSELIRRNPGLTIDNCASGGRRIDLETCSLAYPLWRSDFNDIGEGLKGPAHWPQMALADQVHVSGLALYIPYHTGPIWDMHPYCFRSAMTSGVVLYERLLHPEFPDELAKQGIAETTRLRPLFEGDFYPLLPITLSQAEWHACQWDRPDLKQGCAFVFRRPESKNAAQEIRLRAIDPRAEYSVTIVGETYVVPPARRVRGEELQTLTARIDQQPGSMLIEYSRVSP